MATHHPDLMLPSRDEAIDTIARFTELEALAISDHTELARSLGGLSVALSSVALDYGEKHPYPDISQNIGLWTTIGERDNQHRFAVTGQVIQSEDDSRLVSIWRSHLAGGTQKFHQKVNVPADALLERFRATDPLELRQGWHTPPDEDIYAIGTATVNGVRNDEEYWPFHMPVAATRPEDYPTTPEQDAVGYTIILQGLTKTLLEIVR